jgi:hypothetical protein
MNSVYRFLITGRLALLSAAAAGQGCYCEQLTKADEQALIKGMGFEYSPGKAQELVDTFGGYFRRYLKIIAKPENCADAKTALAIVCDQKENAKLTREGRYIFYKPAFLEAVQEASLGKGDRFVLAHEVAHHALGHTVRVRFINTKDKAQQGVLAGAYQVFETFPPPFLPNHHDGLRLSLNTCMNWKPMPSVSGLCSVTACFPAMWMPCSGYCLPCWVKMPTCQAPHIPVWPCGSGLSSGCCYRLMAQSCLVGKGQ